MTGTQVQNVYVFVVPNPVLMREQSANGQIRRMYTFHMDILPTAAQEGMHNPPTAQPPHTLSQGLSHA